ncbi:hypothetical protein FSP39_019402 [Pinctada imbricata]|uniref:HMG box domain-containing protein n=1 Tax=Pinctada imbricata TaxID=66713 RepID=A0AA89BQ95_PINIB|nr:hypothetical protein FSP39_019402 [Pinctada imbricata]
MWEPPTPPTSSVTSSSSTIPHRPIPLSLSVAQDKDWLLIRTKMPVCIWPESCLLGCALHDPGGSKFQPPMSGLMMYNNEPFAQPPPAHMGIPPVHIDPKTGLPRPSMYAYPPPGQFPPSLYSPDLSQVQWRGPHYPISSGAFSGAAYPPSLVNSSPLSRFGPPGLFPPPGLHPGMPHPGLMSPGSKPEGAISAHSQDRNMLDQGSNSNSGNPPEDKKKNHIKKPLNAFMLFMKEVRAQVVAECTLKESAAINQILGRRWHALDRAEQAKYYEMARKEKELHMQLYPGWSARDNYASHTKKKRKKKDGTPSKDCSNPKKCRARYGLEQQNQWCKPCRRKKKCIRYRVDEEGNEYFIDGDVEGLSDSLATEDSAHDSDSMTGSPMHSVTSDDAFSTPSKSMCHNSPSIRTRTEFHDDIPGLNVDEEHTGDLDMTVKMEDLEVTITSTPRKSLPFNTNIPVT